MSFVSACWLWNKYDIFNQQVLINYSAEIVYWLYKPLLRPWVTAHHFNEICFRETEGKYICEANTGKLF